LFNVPLLLVAPGRCPDCLDAYPNGAEVRIVPREASDAKKSDE
jgi:hypothetical protein